MPFAILPSSSRPAAQISRRTLLGLSAAACGRMFSPEVLGRGRAAPAQGIAGLYANLKSEDYFDGNLRVEVSLTNDAQAFTEGPAVDREGNVFFTNIPASKIYRWDPRLRRLSLFRENSHKANGLLFDADDNLLACEGETGRITRTDMLTGKIAILADSFEGRPLEAPNDLTVDGAGRIYFSSRPSSDAPARGSVNAVYRIDRDGSLHPILKEPDIHMPNGLEVSSDSRTLYLIESHPDAGKHRHLRAYDLGADGNVANPRVLTDFYPGRSGDGLCLDSRGNLYVAAGLHKRRGTSETLDTRPGIHVISPQGKLLGYVETPEDTVTNCAFGGQDLRTLYVTGGARLLSVRTKTPGRTAVPNAGGEGSGRILHM